MTALRMTLLGEVRLELDGESLVLPAKATALICLLAVTRRRYSREYLLELLWSSGGGGDQGANLRVALSKLRKTLGSFLEIDRDSVSLRSDAPLWLDADRFVELARPPGEPARLEEAGRLYRGDFMDGFYLPAALGFEEWLATERERLRGLARECFEALTDRLMDEGDQAAATEYALRSLRVEPWHEAAHRRVMLLHARRGDHEAALQQFERCREMLANELGVQPSTPTEALRSRIEAARNRPPPALPIPVSPLVGREAEGRDLRRRLAKPECRLLNLIGVGGVGKTRLALELAHSLQYAFLEGVHFVPLTGVEDRDGLAAALLHKLAIDRDEEGRAEEPLAGALRDRETLLVLDDLGQLDGSGGEFLVELLEAAPELKLLVTSRARLNLQREWVVPVPGLEYPDVHGVPSAELTQAERLFVQAAERVGVVLSLDSENSSAMRRICRLVAGHPLAIELAAAGTWRASVESTAVAIEGSLDALTTDAGDTPERYRSVRAVFDHSWRQLSPDEKQLLKALTVFEGGFEAEAAQAVCEAQERKLERLVGSSLLQLDGGGRYSFHPLVREYAHERLELDPKRSSDVRRRHASYCLEEVRTALRHFRDEDKAVWVARLAAEQDNVRAALRWAQLEDPLLGLGLVRRLWMFWLLWGQYGEGRKWLAAILEAAPRDQQAGDRAEALNGAASLAFVQGDYPAARQLYRESLELNRERGEESSVAMVLNNLGNVVRTEGELEEARRCYQQSLEIREGLGDRRGIASTLSNLGLLAERQFDYPRAKSLYEQSLLLRREVADVKGIAISLCNLGFVSAKLDELAVAANYFRESLRIEAELGGKGGIADCLRGLAAVESDLGRSWLAAMLWGSAEALREDMGSKLDPAEQAAYEEKVAGAREQVEVSRFESAWQKGRELPLKDGVLLALDDPESKSEVG